MTTDQTGTEQAAAPEAKRRRWPTILLAASLTVNLLVLGLIAGAQFRDVRDVRMAPPPDRNVLRDAGLAPFFDAMPRTARGRLSQAVHGREGDFGPDRTALAQELREMLQALRDEPFDPAVLDALLAEQHARATARAEAGRAVLIGQIVEMTPDERRDFADELEKLFTRALDRVPPEERGLAPNN